MKEIIDIVNAFDKARDEGKNTALATVVHVEGSSYRKEGARMLITEDGELTGAISGGCLEGDALRKALFVMQEKKAKLVVYDTSNEDDIEVGYQLGCNGIIQILIEPINNDDLINPISLLKEAITNRGKAIIATVFSLKNNSSQKGTCLLLKKSGTMLETIHNQVLLDKLLVDVNIALQNNQSSIRKYVYDDNELTAFINILKPQITLVLIGAGNDAIPLVKMGEVVGWKVVVVDGRANYANKKRFSGGCQVMVSKAEEIFSSIEIDEQTMFVLMTHNYNYDLAVLRQLILLNAKYIGILGSRNKLSRMIEELSAEGIDANKELSNVYSPVGLNIGAETPEEIALSIMAEVQAVLSGKGGSHLGNQDSRNFTEAQKIT
jgi:xanthine/CO dehydrogenase XdhC/CoxF family maturation factor